MSNIYELTGDIQLLWNLMDEGAIEDDTLMDAMMNSQEELAVKLEGYCKFIKNAEADVDAFKAEEARLKARRQTMENTIERAKAAMKFALETAGEKKIPCGNFTVFLQKNPASVVMDTDDLDKIPAMYLKIKDPEIDKTLLKKDLDAGKAMDGIAHLEQGESLRIR